MQNSIEAGFKTFFMTLLAIGLALGFAAMSSAREYPLRVAIQAKPKYGADTDLKLSPRITWAGPKEAKFTYRWSVIEGPPLDPKAAEQKDLLLPKNELRSGASYRLRLVVVAEFVDPKSDTPKQAQRAEGSAEVSFKINSPPSGGQCLVEGTRIGKDKINITLDAPGWRDDEPIQYSFVLFRNGEEEQKRGWSGANKASIGNLTFVEGDRFHAECFARDRFNAVSSRLSSDLQP